MTRTLRGGRWVLLLVLLAVPATAPAQQPELPENFPQITIDVATAPSDGVIYLANMRRAGAQDAEDDPTPYRPFVMSIGNDGVPTFIRPIPYLFSFHFGRSSATGQRFFYQVTQPTRGRGAAFDGIYLVLNDDNRVTDGYTAANGLPTQAHDFMLLEDGGYMVLSQPVRVRSLLGLDGAPTANVVETVIQEFDALDRLVFEWRSWEHVRVTDTAAENELRNAPPGVVSYIHGNGFTLDQDGNIILSARRFDELIKINRQSGRIMWRMGGTSSKNNQFTFVDDPYGGFSGQHHPQILPNGNLLLFDNGVNHDPPVSRAVEYALDAENRRARLVWSYENGRFAPAMGSVQRLPNGNTLIGWGTAPPDGSNVTEVTRDGEVVFGLSLPPDQISYRAYRFSD